MFEDRIVADWPLADGSSEQQKGLAPKRLCALLYRFGAEDPLCHLTPDGHHVTTEFTFSAPSQEEAQDVVAAIVRQTSEALEHDEYEYVDEYPWPRGVSQERLPEVRDEVENLLAKRRLQFDVYPMPSESGGIVVELHDVGGATPMEAKERGRNIIGEVYAQAYKRVTGQHYVASHKTIGGIGGT